MTQPLARHRKIVTNLANRSIAIFPAKIIHFLARRLAYRVWIGCSASSHARFHHLPGDKRAQEQ
jgi:hypothetical protein